MSAQVMSAVASVSTPGVLHTVMLRSAQARTSMLFGRFFATLAITCRLGQGIKDASIDRVVQHGDETLRSLRGGDQLVLRERSILSIEPQVRTFPNHILSVDGERASDTVSVS